MSNALNQKQIEVAMDLARRARQARLAIATDRAGHDAGYAGCEQEIATLKRTLHRQRLLVARRRFSVRRRLEAARTMRDSMRAAQAGEAELVGQIEILQTHQREIVERLEAEVERELNAAAQ